MTHSKTLRALTIVMLALGLSACASSGTTERLDALESQIASVQRTADQALDLARQAQSRAGSASGEISEAQRMARQAMDTATETAERLARMEDECCGGNPRPSRAVTKASGQSISAGRCCVAAMTCLTKPL